jgi:hypothetical protein
MPTTIKATFDVTGWDETAYDEPAEGPKLSRVTVTKRFTGTLEATSTAQLLTSVAQDDPNQAGYIGSERVTGTLEGRSGTFVIQHGGIAGGPEIKQFGWVVPGSGTGDLRGLAGTVHFQHDEHGAIFTMEYQLG